MAIPPGLWSMRILGQYVRADGTPHQGFVIITPDPVAITATPGGTPVTIVLQAARLEMDHEGFVSATMLNPNDPTITPGEATGDPWVYKVREVLQRGPVIEWWLQVPDSLGDGSVVDLNMMVRNGQKITRPADWFPYHLEDAQVQASRISPRSGPLMREV